MGKGLNALLIAVGCLLLSGTFHYSTNQRINAARNKLKEASAMMRKQEYGQAKCNVFLAKTWLGVEPPSAISITTPYYFVTAPFLSYELTRTINWAYSLEDSLRSRLDNLNGLYVGF